MGISIANLLKESMSTSMGLISSIHLIKRYGNMSISLRSLTIISILHCQLSRTSLQSAFQYEHFLCFVGTKNSQEVKDKIAEQTTHMQDVEPKT